MENVKEKKKKGKMEEKIRSNYDPYINYACNNQKNSNVVF